MRICPRCQARFRTEGRCPVCGLTAGAPFDPTGGFSDAARYLGRVIGGHFKVLSVLARGGHGIVLLVRHTQLPRRNIFALKLLRPELSQNQEFRRRFLREVEIVYSFSHPNIVPIREFAETDDGELFFTMDFCRGETLDGAMRSGTVWPLRRVVKIAEDILKGLEFAHRHGVIHRDLKPANVFLEQTAQGEVARLLDFGIARPTEGGALEVTGKSRVIGTPLYMAPEQIMGRALSPRTDLYAFGVLLYRLVAGKPPFGGKTGHEVLARHLRDTPPSLCSQRKDVPGALSDLVARLLAKSPEGRPASAAVVRKDLLEVAHQLRRGRKRVRLGFAVAFLCVSLAAAALSVTPAVNASAGAKTHAENALPAKPNEGSRSPGRRAEAVKHQALPPESVRSEELKRPLLGGRKWCRLCRRIVRTARVTCPHCGQVLVRVPLRVIRRRLSGLRSSLRHRGAREQESLTAGEDSGRRTAK